MQEVLKGQSSFLSHPSVMDGSEGYMCDEGLGASGLSLSAGGVSAIGGGGVDVSEIGEGYESIETGGLSATGGSRSQ